MSGGSFDYLYYRIEETPLNFGVLRDLEKMADFLDTEECNQHEAAKELRELHKWLTDIDNKISKKLMPPLLNVIKEAEWWCSNDTGQDDFERVWKLYTSAQQAHAGDATSRAFHGVASSGETHG